VRELISVVILVCIVQRLIGLVVRLFCNDALLLADEFYARDSAVIGFTTFIVSIFWVCTDFILYHRG
jgi:hypothetical protein